MRYFRIMAVAENVGQIDFCMEIINIKIPQLPFIGSGLPLHTPRQRDRVSGRDCSHSAIPTRSFHLRTHFGENAHICHQADIGGGE